MWIFSKELIYNELQKIGNLISLFQKRDSNFTRESVLFLENLEHDLQKIRSPLASFASTQRGRLIACIEGRRDSSIGETTKSKIKLQSITASIVLENVECELRQAFMDFQNKIDGVREKVTQVVTVGTAMEIIPEDVGTYSEEIKRQLWQSLGQLNETKGIHAFLMVNTSAIDLFSIFEDVLDNLILSKESFPIPSSGNEHGDDVRHEPNLGVG